MGNSFAWTDSRLSSASRLIVSSSQLGSHANEISSGRLAFGLCLLAYHHKVSRTSQPLYRVLLRDHREGTTDDDPLG